MRRFVGVSDQGEYRRRVASLHVQAARVQEDDHAVGHGALEHGLCGGLRTLPIPRNGASDSRSDRSPRKNM